MPVNLIGIATSHCNHILNHHIVHLFKNHVYNLISFRITSPEQMPLPPGKRGMMHHLPQQLARATRSLFMAKDPVDPSPALTGAKQNQDN